MSNLNFERLGQGEKIAAGSAIALLVCMFLSWFNFSYSASNAWESLHYTSPILAISIVATLGVAFAELRTMSIGEIPGGLVIFVLGCLSAVLILFRLIDPISTPGIEGGSTSGSVEAGAFLGFFAALGIAAGGYVATDGKAVDRLKALVSSGTGNPGNFSPPSLPSQPQAPPPAAAPPAPPAPIAVAPPPQPPSSPGLAVESAPPVPGGTAIETSGEADQPATQPEPDQTAETDLPSADNAISAEENPQSVFCEGCGGQLRPHDRFCRKCGHQQAQVAAPNG